MKNKIKIVSVLLTLSFLILPLASLADSPALCMGLYGTAKINNSDLPIGTILRAYCGNTTTEIGSVTLTTLGQYGPGNTYLPANNCAIGNNIWVQAAYTGLLTDKKDTLFGFTEGLLKEHNINFTSSSGVPTTPTAPSDLSAVIDSQTEITLSWVDNSSNETAFKVYKDGVLETTTVANVVTYQVTGLTAATAYIFKVRAVNGDQPSDFTSNVSATTLATAQTADPTTGIFIGNVVNPTQTGYVNNSTTETVIKDARDSITNDLTGINVISDIGTSTGALSSITGSSANIIVAKQALALGTATTASSSSTTFNNSMVSTTGVIETIVFVPVDTSTLTGGTTAKRIAVVIPELTLIKDSDGNPLVAVEIRPPSVKDATVTGNEIKTSFSEATAPVVVKVAVSIPASVSGVKFYQADGITPQYIDICMDKSGFTVSASDVQVYYSLTGIGGVGSYALDGFARNQAFVGDQFCFQTNHFSSFAGAQANTKAVACTQSGAPANASYNVNNVTVTWTGSAWSTAANCAWTCDSGFALSDSVCVAGSTVTPGGGGAPSAPSAPAVPMPTTTDGEVTATYTGGGKTTLTTAENTKVTVRLPANAIASDVDIAVVSVLKTAEAITTAVSAVPSGKSLVGKYVYDITAEKAGVAVSEFSKYATITLTYKTSQITGLKESSLKVNYWDETDEKWVELATTVNKTSNTLTAKTLHFTYFAIIGEEGVDAPVTITRAYIREQMKNIIKQLIVLITELITVYQAELLELQE